MKPGLRRRLRDMPIGLKLLLYFAAVGVAPFAALSLAEIVRTGGRPPEGVNVPALLLSVGTLLSLLAVAALVEQIVRPIRKLQEAVEALMAGVDTSLDLGRRDEIGRLAAAFDQLLSQRREVLAALAKERDLFARISETSPAAIVVVGAGGELTFANAKAEEVLGLRGSELGGDPRTLALGEGSDRPTLAEALPLARVLRAGKAVHDETLEITRQGRPSLLSVSAAPLLDAAGSVEAMIASVTDVTRRVEAERERAQIEQQLLQSQRLEALGALASGVAHDFNNLLTIIQIQSEVLLRRVRHDERTAEEVRQIQQAAARATGLTRQLLAFSRKRDVRPTLLDLNRVVQGAEGMLRRLVGEHIEVSARLGAELGPVLADPGQLDQVVINLAVNARDAMPHGGKLVLETASIDEADAPLSAPRAPLVVLRVIDSGVGMDEATAERVFEPFFTTKEPGRGTGLGLATVQQIVRRAGGSVAIDSVPGRGTTVSVYLPVAPGQSPADPQTKSDPPLPGGTETILLVEDEEHVRRLLRSTLEQLGYRVIEAASPTEALGFAQAPAPVHLLLSDIMLPQMNGVELAERLAALKPGLRMLFMSGYDDIEQQSGALPEQLLRKPFTPITLARRVRSSLDGISWISEPRLLSAQGESELTPPERRQGARAGRQGDRSVYLFAAGR